MKKKLLNKEDVIKTNPWNQLTDEDWHDFAQAWLAEVREDELREDELPEEELPEDSDEDEKWTLGQTVAFMNFAAPPEKQWKFILIAVSLAESEYELADIAAGPIEHLLGWHGDEYISRVEEQAESDPKFASVMLGVWQYMMTEEIWARVQAIQERVENQEPSNEGDA